jgi:hypothetical protein
MTASIDTRQSDFSEMDDAGISKEHWKIMFISGMGFFTDAYDLFIIGVVMALLKPMWHVGKVEEGLVESTALLAAAIGALLFGRIADMVGRKRIKTSFSAIWSFSLPTKPDSEQEDQAMEGRAHVPREAPRLHATYR